MNDTIFWRLVWKEYRTQRAFWLALFVLAVLLQLCGLYSALRLRYSYREVVSYYFGIATLLPVFFALGSGAVSFAAEREDRTDELLQRISAPPGRLFACKFGIGVAGTVLMVVLLTVLASAFSLGDFPFTVASDQNALVKFLNQYVSFFLVSMGFLLWSIFFSLLTGHVLGSACLAAAAMLLSIYAIVNSPWAFYVGHITWGSGIGFRLVAGQALVLLTVLGAGEAWLTRRWLAGKRTVPWRDAENLADEASVVSVIEASGSLESAPPWRRQFQVLVWKEWRQALRPALSIAGTILLLNLYFGNIWDTTKQLTHNLGASILILAAPLMMGVFAFHAEQRSRGHRFLGERGVFPSVVWLTKHVIWLSLATAVSILLLVLSPPVVRLFCQNSMSSVPQAITYRDAIGIPMAFLVSGLRPSFSYESDVSWWWNGAPVAFSLLVVLLYSVGQLVSLLIPRGITSSFAGLFLGLSCFLWYGLMVSFNVPLGFSVLPLPVIFLVVTLVRVRDWMEERNTRRTWWKVGLVGLVPVACVVSGVIAYRVYEIPAVELNFFDEDVPRPATESERAVAAAYAHARQEVTPLSAELRDNAALFRRSDRWTPPIPLEEAWVSENADVIQQLVQTSRASDCALLDPATASADEYDQVQVLSAGYLDLLRLLAFSAHRLEKDGDLDQALDRYSAALRVAQHVAQKGGLPQFVAGCTLSEYVYYWLTGWAAHPKQRPELLQQAARQLREHAVQLPQPSTALNVHFAVLRQTLRSADGLPWLLLRRWTSDLLSAPGFSWEQARWQRQLNLANNFEYWYLKDFEQALKRPRFACLSWRRKYSSSYTHILPATASPFHRRWFVGGIVDRYLTMFHFEFWQLPSEIQLLVLSSVGHETRLRALLINLELTRYRLEHGQLPASLDDLRMAYSVDLPLDPWIGRDFGYKARGVSARIVLRHDKTALASGKPFLWSAGPFNVQLRCSTNSTNSDERNCDAFTFVDVNDEPVSAELEAGGRCFEVFRGKWPALLHWPQMWDLGRDFYAGILFPVPDNERQP